MKKTAKVNEKICKKDKNDKISVNILKMPKSHKI